RFIRRVERSPTGQQQTEDEPRGSHAILGKFGVETNSPSFRTSNTSTPRRDAASRSPWSGPMTKMAVESASASNPVGAITVTLDSVVGERPVAGSKMWWVEKSSLNLVS